MMKCGSRVRRLRNLWTDKSGNVVIIAALALPVLLGIAGLVAEYGRGLADHARNQRVADLSAYAGALTYRETQSTDRMRDAARSVAALNGIAAADVEASLENSPANTGSQAVFVQVRTKRDLFLSRIIDSQPELYVSANAMAEIGGAGTAACILALDPDQSGVTLSGGTEIRAEKCAVSSNNTVTVPCGTEIVALGVNYDSPSAPSQPCSGITAATIAKKQTPDPFADNTAIKAALARIDQGFASIASMTVPAAPTATNGGSIEFAYNNSKTISEAAALGCTASKSGNTWSLDCGSKAVLDFGTITVGGGINLDFNVNGPKDAVYNFSRPLTTTATTRFGSGTFNFVEELTTNGTTSFGSGKFNFGKDVRTRGTTSFGSGTFHFSKGLTTDGGSTTSFGAGSFKFGRSSYGCNGASYSVCNTSTLTFGGPSTFDLYAGFANTGGSTLTFGSGSSNSFRLGPSSNGNAIDLGGGSKTIMGDAVASGSLFEVKGHVNGGGGGSCFVVSAAANHDISGNFIASGAVLLGAGIYTIDGYFALGQSGGGSANCNGQSFSVEAVDVTLVISGKEASKSGSCNGTTFCIAAGYNGVQITAPQTGALAKVAVIGPQDESRTAGATFSQGSSNTRISGLLYFPNGPVTMSGGASASGSDDEKCLQIIGSHVTLSGGTSVTSECVAAAGSSSGGNKISLIR